MKFSITPFYVLLGLLLASFACAQEPAGTFQEAVPPTGVVKGFVNNGKSGVLVIGGRVVYPDETFTVTSNGRKVIWKVIEIKDRKARFARSVSDPENPLAPPPDSTPNYGAFLAILQQGTQAHKAASTSVQKEQIMTSLRDAAKAWCAGNAVFCIRGIVTDLTMLDDTTAQLRLNNADAEKVGLKENFIYHGTFRINIPLPRDQALGYKAGHHVLLCGRPTFLAGPLPLFASGITRQTPFASFHMLYGASIIGSLQIDDPRFEIYDPANETIQ